MKLGAAVIFAFVAWVIPPVVLSLWLALTPNVVLAQADAGEVVAVRAEHRWFSSEDNTTLETTAGTFTVEGIHSVPRGQRLIVKDSTKDGEQVCGEQSRGNCADLSGDYLGVLRAVPHRPVVLNHAIRVDLLALTELWALIAGVVFALVALFWLVGRADGCKDCGAGERSV